MADQQQPPPPQPRPAFSGTAQVLTAVIGAVATISGALIAASWGRGGQEAPVVRPTASPTWQHIDNADRDAPVPAQSDPVADGSARSSDGDTQVASDNSGIDYSSLLGQWRGAVAGSTTSGQIVQNDDGSIQVTSQAQTPNGTVTTVGQGRMSGTTARWTFTDNTNASGQCAAQMSADGHQLQGACQFSGGAVEQVMMVR